MGDRAQRFPRPIAANQDALLVQFGDAAVQVVVFLSRFIIGIGVVGVFGVHKMLASGIIRYGSTVSPDGWYDYPNMMPLTWLRRLLARLLPPATPQPDDRESVWSIGRRDARTFFRLLSALWLVALIYVGYKTLNEPASEWQTAPAGPWWQTAGDFSLAVMYDFGGVGVGIAILSMLLTRPLNVGGELLMSLYQAMVNRFVIPVIEARRAEGRVEGRAEERAEWRAWNRRRMDAEAGGLPFTEPPPGDWPDDDGQDRC